MSLPKIKLPKINIKLKKTVLLVVAAAVIGAVGFASVRHWDNYTNAQAIASEKAAQESEEREMRAQAAEDARRAELVNKYNALLQECQKGRGAWDRSASNVRRILPQPQCGVAITE